MKGKKGILLFIAIIVLSGCSISPSGSNIPENISKEHYKMFVESYELYEERVLEYSGKFVDVNGELIDFSEEGIFTDSNIMEMSWEDRKREEKGEEGVLTEKENKLKDDFMSLYFIKQLEYLTEDLKQMAFDTNPEYADPVQASIDLEEKIINTLELEKTPITASLQTEDRVTTTETQSVDKDSENYQAYEAARNYITTFFSQGNPDAINHESYKNSDIVKREDGVYYITSTFDVHGSKGLSTYNYEMLLDGNYEILDAYVPGSTGIFDRPMVYDQLGQSTITNMREKMKEEEESKKFANHNRGKTPSPSDSLVYENEEYGFTLTFPESWAGKYNVNENNWYDGAEASITFDYVHDGEVISNIFSLLIFNESEFYGYHDQGMNIYITTNNGKVYASNSVAEPPTELLQNEEMKPILDELMRMVNEDVPMIMESISFS